ncbi:recombinase family protein [Rhodococcus sp. OK302]|uniref:recombinase family protein n=1 Tax=Rhodococcus sp. OK302 TaxID=1882769 RepID=UPI003F930FFF
MSDLLFRLRDGGTLVVWRLDRLGRSLPHRLQTVEDLASRGVGFKSLTEAIDTTTSGGKLIFSIFGALAEFERNLSGNGLRSVSPRPEHVAALGAGHRR